MRKFLSVSLLAAAVSLSGSNAFAVVQTPVNVAGIVAQCEAAVTSTGQCLEVVRAYLAQLRALPAASRDQAITNLVLALAPLGQGKAATAAFRKELAQAVREVAKLASTPQQVASLQNIAGGIERGGVQTAAIPETLGSPF